MVKVFLSDKCKNQEDKTSNKMLLKAQSTDRYFSNYGFYVKYIELVLMIKVIQHINTRTKDTKITRKMAGIQEDENHKIHRQGLEIGRYFQVMASRNHILNAF